MAQVETVLIKSEDNVDGVLINKSDFIEGEHELYSGAQIGGNTSMTKNQLKAELTRLEVEFPASANKKELQELLENSTKDGE